MPAASDQVDGSSRAAAEPVYPRLTLSAFKVIETFSGFYYGGDPELPAEPRHAVSITAQWEEFPSYRGEEFLRSYKQSINEVSIRSTDDRETAQKRRLVGDPLTIYLMESVFLPLLNAVRRDDIENATLNVGIEPYPMLADRRAHMIFGDLEIVHKVVAKKQIKLSIVWLVTSFPILLCLNIGFVWLTYLVAKFLASLITGSAIDQAVMGSLATVVTVSGSILWLWQRLK
jgi:hypothetical protein